MPEAVATGLQPKGTQIVRKHWEPQPDENQPKRSILRKNNLFAPSFDPALLLHSVHQICITGGRGDFCSVESFRGANIMLRKVIILAHSVCVVLYRLLEPTSVRNHIANTSIPPVSRVLGGIRLSFQQWAKTYLFNSTTANNKF